MKDKIHIKNGTIVDGSGSPSFAADLLLSNGVIEEILPPGSTLKKVDHAIDASGLTLAPGFIDTHSHNDIQCLHDPLVAPKLFQGITTDVLGQDGLSLAPCPGDFGEWKTYLKSFYGSFEYDGEGSDSTKDYLDTLSANKQSSNKVYLVPHGNIRFAAMGGSNGQSDEQELQKMEQLLQKELEEGGAGFSTGLIYPPCSFADSRELIRLCSVTAEAGKPFVVHQRSEADDILASMEELFLIARESKVDLHISHFKICGFRNGEKLPELMQMLDRAADEGIKLSYDLYPYMAGSTSMSALLPPWVKKDGLETLFSHLNSRVSRSKIIQNFKEGLPGWDNFVDFAGFDNIFVSSVKNREHSDLIGLSLTELGEKGSTSPEDALFDLLLQEDNEVGMIDIYGEESVMEELLKRPEANLCSDGLLIGTPHPRTYGAFPRVLDRLVRQNSLFSLEEGIRKMTSKGAEVFGLHDRGLIKAGFAADLVLFDPESIVEKGSFTDSQKHPEGISKIIVNGELSYSEGKGFPVGAGQIIKLKNRGDN